MAIRSRYVTFFVSILLCTGSFADRPNILWITSEDNGPHMGCYGDTNAVTPNLDALATKGTIYLNAWSTLPVCAPARTTIITGMYPSSLGAEHMRSFAQLPKDIRLFPEYLREAGYYCTNNQKEDYNVPKSSQVWDDSSGRAHWKNREKGQPFFAVFNINSTHESQIRKSKHKHKHNPSEIKLPAHYPDLPESRTDWAQYYDRMTQMDLAVGIHLKELKDAGLDDNTIVMYYGDHGVGLPRSKRSPYNSGLRVPLIVHIPEKFESLAPTDLVQGGQTDRLVSFLDLAPTLLTVAGQDIPNNMQGKAFLGAKNVPEKAFLFGIRGRMDERYDMVRVVRDKQYLYMKNYMPHRPHGQHVAYMFQTPSTRAWFAQYEAGNLAPEHAYFWERRSSEELYDLHADPDEIENLASNPAHAETLDRLRNTLNETIIETHDVGFIPEPDYHAVYKGKILHDIGHDAMTYPLELVQDIAFRASSDIFDEALLDYLHHENSSVRYWATTGILIHQDTIDRLPLKALRRLLTDDSPSVRVVTAEILALNGSKDDRLSSLSTLLALSNIEHNHVTTATFALNALDYLGEKVAPIKTEIRNLSKKSESLPRRNRHYIVDLVASIENNLN